MLTERIVWRASSTYRQCSGQKISQGYKICCTVSWKKCDFFSASILSERELWGLLLLLFLRRVNINWLGLDTAPNIVHSNNSASQITVWLRDKSRPFLSTGVFVMWLGLWCCIRMQCCSAKSSQLQVRSPSIQMQDHFCSFRAGACRLLLDWAIPCSFCAEVEIKLSRRTP